MDQQIKVNNDGGLVNVDINEKKFATIQKYFLVFVIIVQGWCISVLWKQIGKINEEFRGSMFDLLLKTNINIQESTNTMKEIKTDLKANNKNVNP